MIQPGQIYRSCDPRGGARVRITDYRPGDTRAEVVDAVTGKRPRRILVKDLHESPVTATGRRRRSGYVLDRDTLKTPQEAVDGPQGAPEGVSGQRENQRGQNEAQAGSESFGHSCPNCEGVDPDTCLLNRDRPTQPARGIRGLLEHVGIDLRGRDIAVAGRVVDAAPNQPRGPVDWARQQAAEREKQHAAGDLQQQIAAAIRDTPARYPDDIAAAVMAAPGMKRLIAQAARRKPPITEPERLADSITRVRTLAAELFVTGATHTHRSIGRRLLNALQPPVPDGDGPAVAECAKADAAHWDAKYAGEGQ